MAFNLEGLSLKQMMQLRVQLNEAIVAIEEEAFKELNNGNTYPSFALSKGKTSRVIADPKKYRRVLEEAFSEQFKDLCITESVLPLTKAEALIKKQFDGSDSQEILTDLAKTLATKTSASKLVYTGED